MGVAYSRELGQGCYPQLQHLLPGKHVFGEEDELNVDIRHFAAAGRLERVSAYRQLQGVSAMAWRLHRRGFEDCEIPNASIGAVPSIGGRRVAVQRGDVSVAVVITKAPSEWGVFFPMVW